MLRPKVTVPMHYNTWPLISQDASDFVARAEVRGHHAVALAPGATLEI
jgi:L-ascorbate metabolism protein UlaG (beta-lactamase superfamily)